jgi:hypothetical protein
MLLNIKDIFFLSFIPQIILTIINIKTIIIVPIK